MRHLAQTGVLWRAGVAAAITVVAAFPRLALWPGRTESLLILGLLLLWSTFVMWAFVFAWQGPYGGRTAFDFPRQPRLWAIVTAYGLAAGVWLRLVVDPTLRLTTPGDYPVDLKSWVAMSLFMLAFDPLFLCYSPLAFFMRLGQRPMVAKCATVAFGVFILYLKLHALPVRPGAALFAMILVVRAVAGYLTLHFYVQGGVWVVWWLILLSQMRHLVGLPF